MAQYRATIQGMRGEASRLGSKASGMYVTVDGWHVGVRIQANHMQGEDVLHVTLTGGSNRHVCDKSLGIIKVVNDTVQFISSE